MDTKRSREQRQDILEQAQAACQHSQALHVRARRALGLSPLAVKLVNRSDPQTMQAVSEAIRQQSVLCRHRATVACATALAAARSRHVKQPQQGSNTPNTDNQ